MCDMETQRGTLGAKDLNENGNRELEKKGDKGSVDLN